MEPVHSVTDWFARKNRDDMVISVTIFMLTLFSGSPFPGVRFLGSFDLCPFAREKTRDSWT